VYENIREMLGNFVMSESGNAYFDLKENEDYDDYDGDDVHFLGVWLCRRHFSIPRCAFVFFIELLLRKCSGTCVKSLICKLFSCQTGHVDT